MSENQTAEVTATETEVTTEQPAADQKPTETVEFWKQKAREQEKRAKDNAAAAKRLTELEDAQKSEAEKAADRVAKAEAEVASVPTKVADALRPYLMQLAGDEIDPAEAEVLLTATEPDLLIKQFTALRGRSDKRQRRNHVPREGENPTAASSEEAAFAREFFSG